MEAVLQITEPLLSQQRDNWELLYREGVAWALLDKPDEALNRFQRILALKLPHDTLGSQSEEKLKQAQSKAKSENLRGRTTAMPKRPSPLTLLSQTRQVQQAVGLSSNRSYPGGIQPKVWTPDAYGSARMAAYAWRMKFDEDAASNASEKEKGEPVEPDTWIHDLSKKASEPAAERDTIYDWLYVASLKSRHNEIFQAAKHLAVSGGREETQYFLRSIVTRHATDENDFSAQRNQTKPEQKPLSDDEIDLMLRCFEESRNRSNADQPNVAGGQYIISNGQVFVNVGGAYMLLSSDQGNDAYLGQVLTELKLAGRQEQAESMLMAFLEKANTSSHIASAMHLLFAQEKFDRLFEFYLKWFEYARKELENPKTLASRYPGYSGPAILPLSGISHFVLQWIGKLGPEEEYKQVLVILDPALDFAIEEGKKRRHDEMTKNAKVSSRSTSPNYQRGFQFQMTYGKENIWTQVDFPTANTYLDTTALTLLRSVFEVFKRNDVRDDLTAHLRQRVAKANPDNVLYEELLLAAVLWWCEEQDEAVGLMAKASEALKTDINFRFEMAMLRELRGITRMPSN